MRIAFLYTELADYTIACMRALKESAPDTTILVIHFPINPEAPFRFDFEGIGEFICLDSFAGYNQLREKLLSFQPEKIVCCGWINKWYVRFCNEYRSKALCILTLDNHWYGSPRQQLLRLISRVTLKPVFRKIWVPGQPQTVYAKKLGFREKDIMTGFYCCDLNRYNALYRQFHELKKQQFPRRFLCVARYIPSKNYAMLWKAFIRWKERTSNDWELWCAGTGDQFEQRMMHPAIRHLGFVQKDAWAQVIAQTGIFVLPSLSEPWAVAVHEFSASGYPLILSNRVGAAGAFLTADNGWQFDPGNQEELESCFEAASHLTHDQLLQMGEASHRQAQLIVPEKWASTLLQA